MPMCSRCSKPLSNPKSIERGMGPICYSKSNKKMEEQFLDKGEQEQNDYPTLSEYIRLLDNPVCLSCQADLMVYGDIDHYKHNGGFDLRNYKSPQWIFFSCSKCKKDSSLRHLLHYHKKRQISLETFIETEINSKI